MSPLAFMHVEVRDEAIPAVCAPGALTVSFAGAEIWKRRRRAALAKCTHCDFIALSGLPEICGAFW